MFVTGMVLFHPGGRLANQHPPEIGSTMNIFAPLNDIIEDIEQEDAGDFDPNTTLGIDEDSLHVAISTQPAGYEAPTVVLPGKTSFFTPLCEYTGHYSTLPG
jgi:hypothetical protein